MGDERWLFINHSSLSSLEMIFVAKKGSICLNYWVVIVAGDGNIEKYLLLHSFVAACGDFSKRITCEFH